MIQSDPLKLKEVSKSDYRFLYDLLKERDPSANISHRETPTFQNHVKFVKSKPYSKWYVILINNKKVGSIYLTKQNEIGLSIKKEKWSKGLGRRSLKLMIEQNPRERYLANISPKNKRSMKFFKKNGFRLIQFTYELRIAKK